MEVLRDLTGANREVLLMSIVFFGWWMVSGIHLSIALWAGRCMDSPEEYRRMLRLRLQSLSFGVTGLLTVLFGYQFDLHLVWILVIPLFVFYLATKYAKRRWS